MHSIVLVVRSESEVVGENKVRSRGSDDVSCRLPRGRNLLDEARFAWGSVQYK
jgi:hypothetical protein